MALNPRRQTTFLSLAFTVVFVFGMTPTGAGPAGFFDGPNPGQVCQQRGYPDWDAFPSRGVAAMDVDWFAASGAPNPLPGPAHQLLGPMVVELRGDTEDTVICRSQPLPPGCQENCIIQTEMISLGLHGSTPLGPISVDVNPNIRSLGQIHGASVDPLGEIFGGFSVFDVFVDIEIQPLGQPPLQATSCLDPNQPFSFFCNPFRVEADLTGIQLPPVHGVSYNHPFGTDVDLWVDPDAGNPEDEFIIGKLLSGCHKPYQVDEPDEHHLCTLSWGSVTPDGHNGACLQNAVTLAVVDSSASPHTITAVMATPSSNLQLTPFLPLPNLGGPVVWTAQAVTNTEQCTDVGVTVSAAYADLHVSPAQPSSWRQHA